MSMLCIKTTAIVIKHSTSLATDSRYFKTKKNLHINVGAYKFWFRFFWYQASKKDLSSELMI